MTTEAPVNPTPTNDAPTPAPVIPPAAAPAGDPAPAAVTPPTDAPAPADKPAVTSTLSDDLPEPKEAAAPADWPTDWREKLSGGDEKLTEIFKRYNSPNDVAKAFMAQRQKLSDGSMKAELPENATPEQVAEYRKQVGIPDAPDKYDLTLADGLTIGDDDKPILEAFLKDAHASNMPQKELTKALNAYYKQAEDHQIKLYEADLAFKAAMEDTLRAEWGAEYRANQNMVNNLFAQHPDIKDKFEYARDSTGNLLMNDPDVIRYFAAQARERNTPFTNIPNGVTQQKHMETRKAEIETMMRTEPSAYYTNERVQSEYRQIIEAEMSLKKQS